MFVYQVGNILKHASILVQDCTVVEDEGSNITLRIDCVKVLSSS